MLSIHLDADIEQRLMRLAKLTGKTEAELAHDLVRDGMEDLEDISIAEARLANLVEPLQWKRFGKNLGWTIKVGEQALKDLKKLDRRIQMEIVGYLHNRIAPMLNPAISESH